MRMILLLAGEGRRLRPYTNDLPKSLVQIDKRSLLERQLDVIKSSDIEEIVAVTGYKANKLDEFDFTAAVHNPNYSCTNMAYSLLCAKDYLDQSIIISYGDIVYSPEILKRLISTPGELVIAIDENWENYWKSRYEDPLSDLESLKLDQNRNIIDIGKPVTSFEEIDGQYIGLLKVSLRATRYLINSVEKSGSDVKIFSGKSLHDAYMTDIVQMLIENGFVAIPCLFKEPWVEVDTVADFESIETTMRLQAIDENIAKFTSGEK